MKIDKTRMRKSTSEVPLECQQLIERLQACAVSSETELLEELSKINTWTFGKCELFHWAPVLDIFDNILDEAAVSAEDNSWALHCDTHYTNTEKNLLLWILHFSTLLIEHSFSRHLYNSMEHLLVLLHSNDMAVVLGVLNLLYMFSKRSNFITRLKAEEKSTLTSRLLNLAENWGGKENGFGLADCCASDKPIPPSATTLHVEFHAEDSKNKDEKLTSNVIHIEHVDKLHKTPAEIMKSLVTMYQIPADKEMWLFTHVRLAHHFADYRNRLLCVQARLQALSVLIYSNAIQDSPHNLLYNGILDELVELVELSQTHLVEIRSAALRTLTAIIHLDRSPHIPKKPGSRLHNIIDVTGASQYHGFLPVLVRNCISTLTNKTDSQRRKSRSESSVAAAPADIVPKDEGISIEDSAKIMKFVADVSMNSQLSTSKTKFPLPLATALFSFLYHLASYESGGEALVSCGMMESLLQVINWHGVELEHITFVTRAVRVIDLITNIDMQAFHVHGGLQSFINRLNVEVQLCSKDILYELKMTQVENLEETTAAGPSTSEPAQDSDTVANVDLEYLPENVGKTCLPQRAALLKSMLNFLKKALQDSTFSDNIRHLMEGSLPNSLKNIIANAEYYGPSLFLLATDVVTVYVYQEPSLLSTLQDNGLTDVILHALLVKEVPPTREVLGSLPNVFSALCLNNRGVQAFVKYKPFEKFFKVLLMPSYLPAMRRRRSSEPLADTACNVGNAMDELMRHQPSLKGDATKAIVKLLQELVHLGTDPKYICWRPHSKAEVSPTVTSRNTSNAEGSSDEEDDDEEEASTSSQNAQTETQVQENSERKPIALIDYILNVMKFIDAILSNNSTDDHCREFVAQGGLPHLLKILALPNLPVDCPVTNPAQAVATVCKSILNLAHEPQLFEEGLTQLADVLTSLKPLYTNFEVPGGSKLLPELASASNIESAFSTASATPLLHAMGAAHGYVIMFVHVCRTGQTEIRNLSLEHWGSLKGVKVLKGLFDLYTSLVWESTLLLAYCSDELMPSVRNFPREELEKLHSFFYRCDTAGASDTPGNVASAMEALTTNPPPVSMDIDNDPNQANKPYNLKYIKPLLGPSSRLGRALAELFGLLVKLSVGSPIRQRRGQNIIYTLPSPFARIVAITLSMLLSDGLDWEKLPPSGCRLTFLICSVGFTSPMLFDEKRYPYYLMLKKFVKYGGQATFFKTFRWALSAGGTVPLEEGLEHANLPEGTGGFLDAWLMLLEKMVNPKAILESPRIIPNQTTQNSPQSCSFDPLKYLIQIHKLAFEAVLLMWGKKPLPKYGPRMTDCMLTIFRHILRGEKLIKEKLKAEEGKAEAAAPVATATAGPTPSTTATRESDVNPDYLRQLMDMGFSREHALEALLHTSGLEQATDYLLSNPPHLTTRAAATTATTSTSMDVDLIEDPILQSIAMSVGFTSERRKEESADGEPLGEEAINQFTESALQVCLRLIKVIPESVHKVCELLVTIIKRNGKDYRDNLLDTLVSEIYGNVTALNNICAAEATSEDHMLMIESLHSHELTQYTHLFILFFEVSSYFDIKIPCVNAVYRKDGFLNMVIELISSTEKLLVNIPGAAEPKWLAPVILLIDEISKVSLCTERKDLMHRNTSRTWRWFDVVTGKWTPYSNFNNKLINDAYWNGEQSMRVTCGRRRYTVTFSNMLQMNDESGNNRPISMSLMSLTHPSVTDIDSPVLVEPLLADCALTEREASKCTPVPNLTQQQKIDIVKACVRFMHFTTNKDLLHSLLQICVRLTRDYEIAKIFVQEGGVKCLLNMRHIPDFGGFGVLATILIKHALEEPNTLAYAIEKVIRGRTLSTIPPPYKDLVYITRQIGGAVTRCPKTFFEVAKNILRIDTSAYRIDDVDTRLPVKAEPISRAAPALEERASNDVICDLLEVLLKPLEVNTDPLSTAKPAAGETSAPETAAPASQASTSTAKDATKPNETPDSYKIKPMLPKSVIVKILADAVVSYGPIAKIITEYTYTASPANSLKENCTVLTFILDKLLSEAANLADGECSSMCRMLLAAIASSNHSPDAQFTLINEVKAALGRAVMLPESNEKHAQIQHICGIIYSMIEHCPPAQAKSKTQQPGGQMNNIVKLMIKKGLFNDLARVPHFLDLSFPNTSFTANYCLKPLEALSRIVNQPMPTSAQGKKKTQRNTEEAQSGASTTEGTNAQVEETIEDAENTEHDISAVASSLEANNVETNESDNVLEEIMEQLLDQGSNNDVPSNRNHTMEIDEDGNLTFDERDATEELMSTDSADSDSNASDQIEDEENEDNEGDEENIDETDENDEQNYDDVEDIGERRRIADNDDDILMIHYTNADQDILPRIRFNENGFAIPIFEDANAATEQSGSIVHPLLVSRNGAETNSNTITRTQRANRARRYQYLFNPRNPNPPVILQRLLGPHDPHIALGANNLLGAAQDARESARVFVMDNFGLLPTHEEQIDFVDQSGFLFGPSLAATLNHVPPVLHWWNIESRCLDLESIYDTTTYVCNELIPHLIKHRNVELKEKKSKETDDKAKRSNRKQKLTTQSDDSQELPNITIGTELRELRTTDSPTAPVRRADEDIDGIPLDEDENNTNEINAAHNLGGAGDGFAGFAVPTTQPTRQDASDTTSTEPGSDRPIDFDSAALYPITNRSNVIIPTTGSAENQEQEDTDDGEGLVGGNDMFFCRRTNLRFLFEEALNQQIVSLSNSQPDAVPAVPTSDASANTENATQSTQTGDSNELVLNLDLLGSPPGGDVVMNEPGPGPSTGASDDVPEGVDPSFLAAIPPEMRREVLEQHRMLNIQQRLASAAQQATPTAVAAAAAAETPAAGTSTEVSPEFLAALPPALQEEVLTQQRLEQQRQAASRANPNEPVDAGAFFETLQPSLRTMILSDMEDSQMSALPPDLAAEAANLRRDLEARNRQMVQERFIQNNLTTIIRHTTRGRLPARQSTLLPHRAQWGSWGRDIMNNPSTAVGPSSNMRIKGRQLLDHEGLSCLLILLFTDDPALNKLRLHRVIRNLCYHAPTREWIVNALLSIIERSVHTKPDEGLNKPSRKSPKPGPLSSKLMTDTKLLQSGGSWLNIRMEAALGCSANVFIVTKSHSKRSERTASANISIHPQAAPIICKNALELLISLSKAFPISLLPLKCLREDDKSSIAPVKVKTDGNSDFWDMLIKLDSASTKKGKSLAKSGTANLSSDSDNTVSFEQSVFGQLLNMLSSPVINKNTQLTDNLLRLLSVITSSMPELTKPLGNSKTKSKNQKFESFNTPTQAINLAVNVITYKSCSEEGLEYITSLLLNLASASLEMSYMILNLLLTGAKRIGDIVREQIQEMLVELQNLNSVKERKTNEDSNPSTSKGTIYNRFTKETVIITASTKAKTSCELQLPSMVPLTSKSSSQVFFLRVLRVIVNIRHSIKQSMKRGEPALFQDLLALSDQLNSLDSLWETLSQCLFELEHTTDHHAVLVLQPAVEAFFLVHSPQQGLTKVKDTAEETTPAAAATTATSQAAAAPDATAPKETTTFPSFDELHANADQKAVVPPEQLRFLNFAEKHRTVLNQILRQSTAHLADGPFAVLVDHTRILDFDIKRRYFRTELERMDQGIRREETAVHVRRSHIFEDSFRELYRRSPEEWKNRFYIVFEDEEGQDAGGLLREWYVIISRDIFNPMYALFTVSPGDRVTYMINSASHYNPNHLCYYKFVGRVIAKAIYDNKLLECYFTRSFYKHILGISVKYTDMESEDYSFYNSLVYIMENNITNLGLDLTFSTEINEFGVTETRDLIPNGRNVSVTEENKMEYIRLSCQMKMTGAIKQQLNAFLEGFYDIIPMRLISIFNEQELELLISGLPNVDIDDLKSNTEYHKYQANSLQIQWFWRALRSFDQADRAKFLQFVTGTSKVPLQGFQALEGMNGVQKFQIHRDDRSTDRLPSAHTCFNQLDLPVYETYDKLRSYLLKAIHECSEGFGFA